MFNKNKARQEELKDNIDISKPKNFDAHWF